MSVSSQVEEQALVAVKSHPLHGEATGWPYCVSDAFEESKTFADRLSLPEEDKSRIQAALSNVESVILVNFWTSTQKPQPLSGGGKLYTFLVHPLSFTVLHGGVGTWRS